MLAMQWEPEDVTHDIAYYAKDSRLTGEPDGRRYKWREMIERFKSWADRSQRKRQRNLGLSNRKQRIAIPYLP